ncbi:acylphosphatase [Candidatus Pacearchaeota archaeon]|nr:MAG: acylphosphatase [Candidatus Pacearchaeota archaeon]
MRKENKDEQECVLVRVFGRVQGVNFRYNVKRFAERAGIRGFVMNLSDGSVLLHACAEREKLDALLAFIRSNPGLAQVRRVEVSKAEANARMKGFEIVREGSFAKDKGNALKHFLKNIFR